MPKNTSIEAIGIDFGTANTAASALYSDGRVELVEIDGRNKGDSRLLKSLLYFPTRKEVFFGQEAIEQYFERDMEGRFLQSVKRLLPNPEFMGTVIHNQHMTTEDLVSRFLVETRRRIESVVGSVEGVPLIMGRPARYSMDSAREALAVVRFKRACDQAAMKNFRFLEEPVAAALTYESTLEREELVLVADLGGGTSDFTLLYLGGKNKTNRTVAVHGIPVAGDALDSAFMMAKLIESFGSSIKYQRPFSSNILTLPSSFVKMLPKWHHHAFLKEKSTWNFLVSLRKELVNPQDKQYLENLLTLVEDNLGYSLHQKVEKLKIELSSADQAVFSFKSHPISIEFEVKRSEFEEILKDTADQIAKTAEDTLRYGKVIPDDLDAIYFTGGTSRVPVVRQAIMTKFPRARVVEKDTFTSVAAGLAMSHRAMNGMKYSFTPS